MKIVIDARELRTSSGRYVERLLHYLQVVDRVNRYIVLLKPEDMDGWMPRSKRFEKLACPYKEFTIGEQLDLLRQIDRLGPDLVHFTFPHQPILYRGRVVTTMHDLTTTRFRNPSKNRAIFAFKQFVYKWVVRIAAHKSREVIAISQFTKDDVAKFARVNSRKITVTLEAADAIPDKPEPLPELEGQDFIMYTGRPLPHKNLGRLIDTFAELKHSHPNLRLVLVGKKDALYKQHEKYVKQLALPDVIFTDFVSEAQLRWLYENAKVYVFPSLSEGFGLPALEAMMHGCAVASSDATCLPEIYGEAALYFDPTDTDDMAKKIGRLLRDQKLRREFIKKGTAQAKKYSWQRMAEQTLEVYHRAATNKLS